MKRLILSILFILCLSFQASAWNPMVVVNRGEDFSDILFWINFENYSAAQTYTLHASNDYTAFGDSTAYFSSDAIISLASALEGSYGLDCTDLTADGNDRIEFDISSGGLDLANTGRIGFYLKVPTGGWINYSKFSIGLRQDGTNEIYLEMVNDDEIKITWEESTGPTTGSVETTDNPTISVDTTYFIEAAWDATPANGSDYLQIWVNGVSKAVSTAKTMTASQFTPTVIQIGTGNANTDVYLDVVVFSSDITRDLYNLVVTRGIANYPG